MIIKKLMFVICASLTVSAMAETITPLNVAYVEVNDNSLVNPSCYIRSDNAQQFFHIVSIFAANINGIDPNKPVVFFNPQVDNLLNHTNQVAKLQSKGIKVILTLLGNHQNAGWSCMTDEKGIEDFANDIVSVINKYKLDGIDIDDEYSICTTNSTSMIRIASALKNHPGFKGKILSKALYDDDSYFAAAFEGKKLADYLDYGWEMSYSSSNFDHRLGHYLNYGLLKRNLALGVNTGFASPLAKDASSFVMKNGYAGVMVFDVKNNSRNYLSQISWVEYRADVKILPGCLE